MASYTNTVSKTLMFFVNGKKVIEENVDPDWTLLYYLRKKLRLCGTKYGCGEGGCGACTVMVSKYQRIKNIITHMPVNACLTPVCSMHGLAVTTVEGIGSTQTKLHPVQERIAKAHGSQCGFCTPGFVMSMYTLLRNMPKPTLHEIETAFQGNLCRCTGYRPIIDGYQTFSEEWEINQRIIPKNGICNLGEKCCKNELKSEKLYESSSFTPYDSSQEPIFPPELKLNSKYDNEYLEFQGSATLWLRPRTLDELVKLKSIYPNGKIVAGNTEIGIEKKFKNCVYPIIIHTAYISELTQINICDSGIRIGASTSIQEIENFINSNKITNLPKYKTRNLNTIKKMLYYFAGKQIRNVATLGGNLMTGSPISDLNPILMAINAEIEVKSLTRDIRKLSINQNFFTSYRRNLVEPDEVLVSIFIPFNTENEYIYAYKQSKRIDDDIAIVNIAIFFEIDTEIVKARIAFSGMAPVTQMAMKTQELLLGQKWNEKILETAYENLLIDFPLATNAPGGMIKYRQTLTLSLFLKGYLKISKELVGDINNTNETCPLYKSAQYFTKATPQSKFDPIGKPLVHMSAFKQAAGTAVYCDDIPSYENELYLAYVLSKQAKARILNIDTTKALNLPGVQGFFSAKDITKERNKFGALIEDDQIFADEGVEFHGQIIGVIVANTQEIARRAANKVKIDYECTEKPIVTLEEAIEKKAWQVEPKIIENGNVSTAFESDDYQISGECSIGGQEHFYLEPNCAVVNSNLDNNEMEIWSTIQHPYGITQSVSKLLDLPQNRIYSRVKRIGGGFGGKSFQTRHLVLPIALAAYKLNRPVRSTLDRNENMQILGGRNPCLYKYKASFSKTGKISGIQVDVYMNSGYCQDVSPVILHHAMKVTNAYFIPNIKITGYICKTNLASNQAFRGFGAPQGVFAAETIIQHIAEVLNLNPIDIMFRNLMETGYKTMYNEIVTHCSVLECLNECIKMSNYYNRKKEIESFNSENRWKKRGISVTPLLYPIGFEYAPLNQGAALVHIYLDGSVLIYHGGVEMGQGLHTKMIQVASRELNVDSKEIHIPETNTTALPNSTTTGASLSNDLYGFAVLKACQELKQRLKSYEIKNPNGTWKDWVNNAYMDRVSLSATGFYKMGEDAPHYWSQGAACSEVELDCLTGGHKLLRTDIVMDIGESLNPAIDVGQIEGGFMQGYGLFTIEEKIFSPEGVLLTLGPSTYKIPTLSDIPREFNVTMIKGGPNTKAVYSSKAIGEPPLCLATSVFFAIKDAVKSSRIENNMTTIFQLNAPATCEQIRLACLDHITSKIIS